MGVLDQPNLTEEDERFVAVLYSTFASNSWERALEAVAEDRPFRKAFAEWVERGLWDENDVASAEALFQENHSGRAALRGRFVNAIRELGLIFTGPDRPKLDRVPFLLIPTTQLNARVFAAPSGLPIVALNQGIVTTLQLTICAVLSFISWHDEVPFCTDLEQGEYAAAIVGLATAVVSNNIRVLRPHREALQFKSLGEFNEEVNMWLQLAEAFIVLHEYGHILGGHLVPPPDPLNSGDVLASEYSREQLNEFEADEYAIRRILATGREHMRPTDVAFIAGLVLRFFALCERLAGSPAAESHPPAIDRWRRVREITHLDTNPDAIAHRLDGGFGEIEARLFPS